MKRISEEVRIDQINSLVSVRFIRLSEPYAGAHSKVCVMCNTCSFEWSTSIHSLVNLGSRCPSCAGNRRYSGIECEQRIIKAGSGKFEFVGWVDVYKNNKSKVLCRCMRDGVEWESSVYSLINNKSGCPSCGNSSRGDGRRKDESLVIKNINNLKNIKFVRWIGKYKGITSRVLVRCAIDGLEWDASASHIIHDFSGCPSCAKSGYDPMKTGCLYALRSECGQYVKVGISNNPKRRHKGLERETPFKFHVIEQISGNGVKIAELEKYFHNKYERAGFTGFDGATEWLICSDELLGELRSINA